MAAGTLHLVAGSTGAGKSTHAARIAAETGGMVFAIDDWMGRLFWPDAPETLDAGWAHERVARCLAQMQAVIAEVAARGIDCVVDAGFTTRAERAAFAAWAGGRSLAVHVHWLDVDAATRWARVESRNASGGGATGFVVTREMFDYVETLWEAPDDAERAALPVTRMAG